MASTSDFYGNLFPVEDTAATGEATFPWHPQGLRVRKVSLTNDSGTETIQFKVNAGQADFATLGPGENILHNVISDGLTIKTISGTADFRAHGEG